jgi:hypothetical protein
VVNLEGVICTDEPDYYFTYIVEKSVINDKNGTLQWGQSYREWTIRAYVLFITSDTRVSLHEYIFRRTNYYMRDVVDFLYARLESQSFEAIIYEL